MDVFFAWPLKEFTIGHYDDIAQCACQTLSTLNKDKAGRLAYTLAMSVVQNLDQDHTRSCQGVWFRD
eukprot:14682324-Heterocapsa_arctica.AAC.1